MQQLKLLALVLFIIIFPSCGEHFYVISGKEINKLALEAREPGFESFIVTDNDTIKGTVLKEVKYKKGIRYWKMDGKDMTTSTRVTSYQTKECFRMTGYPRIYRGKISLYMDQTVINSGSAKPNTTSTRFKLLVNGQWEEPSYNSLKRLLKDCPAAVKEVETRFANSLYVKPKYVDEEMNDYRALVKVLKAYDGCN